MTEYRCFQIDEADIEDLRDRGEDEYYLDKLTNWLTHASELDAAIAGLKNAFAGTMLGDGTGLREAKGMDDYADEATLSHLRASDEKLDWQKIESEELVRCHPAPAFMNPQGFVFHLPAILIAEVNDKYPYGFIDTVINPSCRPQDWIPLLTVSQRRAVAALLQVVSRHPDYSDAFAIRGDKASKRIKQTIAELESAES